MGQSMNKSANGRVDEKKAKEIGPIIDECYNNFFEDPNKVCTMANFYRAVCDTVEKINSKLGGSHFSTPSIEDLEKAFEGQHKEKGKKLTKEEFGKILQELIFKTRLSGTSAKDILLYIFGVPITTLFIKNQLIPTAIPNDVFIPVVTSATVLILAKLNKI